MSCLKNSIKSYIKITLKQLRHVSVQLHLLSGSALMRSLIKGVTAPKHVGAVLM